MPIIADTLPHSYVSGVRFHKPSQKYIAEIGYHKLNRFAADGSITTKLIGIPPEAFEYRLGNRSALDWVIDQYQVSTDKRNGIISDPNRGDDPKYIVRLIGQVIRVSVKTVQIIEGLPVEFSGTPA